MTTLSWEEFLEKGVGGPTAATIGVFDGIHRGHRELIGRVLGASRENRKSLVVTFSENPKKFLKHRAFDGDLMTLAQKLEVFERMGISAVVLIDFSGHFGKLGGRDFLEALKNAGKLEYLAVGTDFKCGHRLDTDSGRVQSLLAESGVVTDIVEPVMLDGGTVSSSRIRGHVLRGEFVEAASLLGRPYAVDLRGLKSGTGGKGSWIPKAEIRQALPPEGSYGVSLAGLWSVPVDLDDSDELENIGPMAEGNCVIDGHGLAITGFDGRAPVAMIFDKATR
jgi:riboflavin kinase / FMN adenylyltransferase